MHPHFYFDSKNINMFREITEDFNKLYKLVDILDLENMNFNKDYLEEYLIYLEMATSYINNLFRDLQNYSMDFLLKNFIGLEQERIKIDKYFAQAVLENDRYQNLVEMTSNKEEITKVRRKI